MALLCQESFHQVPMPAQYVVCTCSLTQLYVAQAGPSLRILVGKLLTHYCQASPSLTVYLTSPLSNLAANQCLHNPQPGFKVIVKPPLILEDPFTGSEHRHEALFDFNTHNTQPHFLSAAGIHVSEVAINNWCT